jgi:hypothetical protein
MIAAWPGLKDTRTIRIDVAEMLNHSPGFPYDDIGSESSLGAALRFSGLFLVPYRYSVRGEPISEVIFSPDSLRFA